MKKTVLILTFLMILLATQVFSAADDIGTTTNNFLKILIPAKGAALGDACVANSDDVSSVFHNPAGIARSMLNEVSFTHVEWFQQVRYENISLLLPMSFGNLGFALNWLSIPGMDETVADTSTTDGYRVLGQFSPYSLTFIGSYAKQFSDDLLIGASLRILNYAINPNDTSGSAMSFMADAGIIYEIGILDGLSVGLSFRNWGFPATFVADSNLQPMDIKGGLGYSNRFFNVEADAEYVNDNELNYCFGAGITLFDILNLRAGWKGGTIDQWTAGGGVIYNGLSLDYAFVPFSAEELGVTHRVTASYRFGAPEVKIAAKPVVFSPNNDKRFDFTFISTQAMLKKKIQSVKLTIYDSFKNVIKSPYTVNLARAWWNGYNDFKMRVPDGTYYAELEANYGGGIIARSNMARVTVDNTPPQCFADADPKVVKPGQMTALVVPVSFRPSAQDLHGIGAWKLIVSKTDGSVFKTFSGTGDAPLEVVWDGFDDTGMGSVTTGTTYVYTFYAMDSVGNWGRSASQQVKVLLREVVINLASDTLFDPGKADVKISVYRDMQKIAARIRESGNPSVIVEGHTDNVPVRSGKYADNMALSQARAEAVVKFFVELFEMDNRLFTAVGKGETMPVASNKTLEGRKQNRRVTIRIKASKWE
ncbi:MAG: PorV/PorQ family protein [Spirochaetia bacterium]|nr:PorV/PorQ family protein [Spirochaetia bacterium]